MSTDKRQVLRIIKSNIYLNLHLYAIEKQTIHFFYYLLVCYEQHFFGMYILRYNCTPFATAIRVNSVVGQLIIFINLPIPNSKAINLGIKDLIHNIITKHMSIRCGQCRF